nr:alpha/beta hydrolase fold-1 [Tanacetum cinerariifolium]
MIAEQVKSWARSGEVITSAEFHLITHCNTLAYSSSKGSICLIDRFASVCKYCMTDILYCPLIGDVSFKEMSMMFVRATFLRGFLVDDEALEPILKVDKGLNYPNKVNGKKVNTLNDTNLTVDSADPVPFGKGFRPLLQKEVDCKTQLVRVCSCQPGQLVLDHEVETEMRRLMRELEDEASFYQPRTFSPVPWLIRKGYVLHILLESCNQQFVVRVMTATYKVIMASEEAKAKWLRMANSCIVDEDYVRESRPPSFIPSSSKSVSEIRIHELEDVIGDTLQKKTQLPESWTEEDELSDEPEKLFSEFESQWIRGKKNAPWHWEWEEVDCNTQLVRVCSCQPGQLVLDHEVEIEMRRLMRELEDEASFYQPRTFSPVPRAKQANNVETPNSELSNAQLLEALSHSERRARESERAAQQAYNEKEKVISLFLKQASQMFAYKQWLYMLQLETLCLRLRRHKYQPICTWFPDFVPWSHTKGKLQKRVHKATKRYEMHRSVGNFLWGLALVGAGVLLGWTLETPTFIDRSVVEGIMPFCEVVKYPNTANSNKNKNGVKIFYKTYGNGPIKVLMIIGVAGTHESWHPQIEGLLLGTTKSNDDNDQNLNGIQVCVFDNRGMGRSSIPKNKSDYTTKIMAADAISLMDHLGWNKAHVFGHSMGGMIACKLAATYPNRVLSLALLNVTGGGYECFPKIDGLTLSIAMRFLRAKTPEQRAAVDLDTHYSQEYLEEYVGLKTRRDILYQDYVKGISASGMQSNHGFDGQINACWTHKVSKTELEVIHEEGFLISIIHGRHDVIAQISHAQRLAEKLYPLARMVELPGGHLVSHERTKEAAGQQVGHHLADQIPRQKAANR